MLPVVAASAAATIASLKPPRVAVALHPERAVQHVLDALRPKNELELLAHGLRDVVEIAAVPRRQDHGPKPARAAATHFSLMPPTGMTTPRRLISPGSAATSARTVR